MDWQVWGPPLGVLGFGLLVGLVWAVKSKGGDKRTDKPAELTAKKNQLLEALRVGADSTPTRLLTRPVLLFFN